MCTNSTISARKRRVREFFKFKVKFRAVVRYVTAVFYCLPIYYLRQGGYAIVVVCLFVCLSVCPLRKGSRTDLHEILREGWQWASEQMVKV